jgi:hypothetical protein
MSANGWYGVDLDGTLAHFDHWRGPDHIGEPVPAMLARVKQWLTEGRDVRIFTARVAASGLVNGDGDHDSHDFAAVQRCLIRAWCLRHVGRVLPVTATKDLACLELWDDRAIQVRRNTGEPVAVWED